MSVSSPHFISLSKFLLIFAFGLSTVSCQQVPNKEGIRKTTEGKYGASEKTKHEQAQKTSSAPQTKSHPVSVTDAASNEAKNSAPRLNYIISYSPDSFTVIANFDIEFADGGSTNFKEAGIKFSGTYGQPVKSEVFTLKGERTETKNGLEKTVSSVHVYYLTGTIQRIVNEKTLAENQRALSIHLEEEIKTTHSLH
jgi:hypothetical protein